MSDRAPATERTVWARSVAGQLGSYLRTESGSSGVLVAAIVVAILWTNLGGPSYEDLWTTQLGIDLGGYGLSMELREWVSSGLMTLFFLVVGLEARREIDLGTLRDRRQFVIPFTAGLVGMAVPVGIFLLVNSGGAAEHGWGVAMSTDTALALGLLTILGRRLPERIRGFLVTVFIVDDLVALLVIAIAYSRSVQFVPLLVAVVAFALMVIGRRLRFPRVVAVLLALGSWLALLYSGVDPIVLGLAIGLATPAFSPVRGNLEEATGLFKDFREQPTPALARSATEGLRRTLSPNERLQSMYHPWTSYVIVPLFALANAGIRVDGAFLVSAFAAPVTIGVILAYVIGKPVAITGVSLLVTALSRGRIRPPVGWAAVLGSGTIAGIGFTVAVLVATLAFHGRELAEAKVGILSAAILASVVTWLVFRVTALLPAAVRTRALLGTTARVQDLTSPIDARRDHARGPEDATVTIVEYGDFQCPFCGLAEPSVRDLVSDADVRFVWRHLPIYDVHPQAELAAEAAEAAAAQGRFWEMHDLLLQNQEQLRAPDLERYAAELGLDLQRFRDELSEHSHRSRIDGDVLTADLSGASGTPTFFINGQRHYGAYDILSLEAAVEAARDEARVNGR